MMTRMQTRAKLGVNRSTGRDATMPCGLASRRIVSPWNNGGSLFNKWHGLRHIENRHASLSLSFPLSFAPACFALLSYSLYLHSDRNGKFSIDSIRELFEKVGRLWSSFRFCFPIDGNRNRIFIRRGESDRIFYTRKIDRSHGWHR